jgi:hypothetical protein
MTHEQRNKKIMRAIEEATAKLPYQRRRLAKR